MALDMATDSLALRCVSAWGLHGCRWGLFIMSKNRETHGVFRLGTLERFDTPARPPESVGEPRSWLGGVRRGNNAKSYRDHAACMFAERHSTLPMTSTPLVVPSGNSISYDEWTRGVQTESPILAVFARKVVKRGPRSWMEGGKIQFPPNCGLRIQSARIQRDVVPNQRGADQGDRNR